MPDHADEPSQASVAQPFPHLADGGMEPATEADPQQHAGLLRGGNGGASARVIERDRFLDEDVLARRRRELDLLFMLAVRRREDDSIDAGIGEDRFVIVDQAHALAAAKLLGLGPRARMAADEADVVGLVLNGIDERASPTPQADDGCVNHFVLLG
jgi:hypothetical protein